MIAAYVHWLIFPGVHVWGVESASKRFARLRAQEKRWYVIRIEKGNYISETDAFEVIWIKIY